MNLFFSRKKTPVIFEDLAIDESTYVETAKIHKPNVFLPSFVFGEDTQKIEVANDTFINPLPSKPLNSKALKIDQSALDLHNVVVSYTNENYVPPSSLPNLQPLRFQTFKRTNLQTVKPKQTQFTDSNPDAIELCPD